MTYGNSPSDDRDGWPQDDVPQGDVPQDDRQQDDRQRPPGYAPPPPGCGPPPPGYGPVPPGYGQYPGYGPSFAQGPMSGWPPPGQAPSNYLGWAIAATLLCCLPAGIVAIVYAAQVNSKWMAGDFEGAMRSSSNAKTWLWISVVLGLVAAVAAVAVSLVSVKSGTDPVSP